MAGGSKVNPSRTRPAEYAEYLPAACGTPVARLKFDKGRFVVWPTVPETVHLAGNYDDPEKARTAVRSVQLGDQRHA